MGEMTDEEAERARQATIRHCNLMLTVSAGTLVAWALIDYRSLLGAIVWGYVYSTLLGIPLAIAMWLYTRERDEPCHAAAVPIRTNLIQINPTSLPQPDPQNST